MCSDKHRPLKLHEYNILGLWFLLTTSHYFIANGKENVLRLFTILKYYSIIVVHSHIRETNTNVHMQRSESSGLMEAILKTPSDVRSKMGTVIVFRQGLLYMQFTYPTAWHESWVMARGIQQWNNFRLFQLGGKQETRV